MKRNPRILQPATVLTNNKGETIALLTGATLETLRHLGVNRISLTDPSEPLTDGWWRVEDMEEVNKRAMK
jgi:hypothetical protein